MAQYYPRAAWVALLFISFIACQKKDRSATVPVYFQIPELLVDTEYSEEGSSHSKINTIWIYANNEHQGTFDLPCTTPVILPEGSSDIRLFPGISLNGSSSSRIIYDFYEPLDFKYAHANNGNAVADTFKLSQAQRTTQYTPGSRVIIFENFDDPGLNLEPTSPSDTTILTTGDPNEIFVNPQDSSEINGKAGKIITTSFYNTVEVATVSTYNLPRGGSNVYVEVSYKSNIPFVVGLIANSQSGINQSPTVVVNPKDYWNKIYVNLVTDLTAYAGADNYKIFIGASHESSLDTGKVFLDNLKLVY